MKIHFSDGSLIRIKWINVMYLFMSNVDVTAEKDTFPSIICFLTTEGCI
jgi:hypothetical protein